MRKTLTLILIFSVTYLTTDLFITNNKLNVLNTQLEFHSLRLDNEIQRITNHCKNSFLLNRFELVNKIKHVDSINHEFLKIEKSRPINNSTFNIIKFKKEKLKELQNIENRLLLYFNGCGVLKREPINSFLDNKIHLAQYVKPYKFSIIKGTINNIDLSMDLNGKQIIPYSKVLEIILESYEINKESGKIDTSRTIINKPTEEIITMYNSR